VLTTFVILGVAVTGILQVAQLRITETLQQKIFTRAAFEFAYRIPRIKLEAFYRQYAPELMNRFFDTINVQKGLSKILIDFSTAVLQVIFGLILLSFYHAFFIVFSLILILLVIAIVRFTARKGLVTSLQESKHKYQVAHWLQELARTSTTFKLAGTTDLPLQRVNTHVNDYLEARESHFQVLVRQYSLMVAFKVIVATGLLAIGGILVMEQQMNIGQFVAAEIIILLVMGSVEKLIVSMETIYDVLTALEKIGQVTDLDLESEDGVDLVEHCQECGLEVHLDDIHFAYPENRHNALREITLNLKSGEKLMITGANGSGKSTLLHVLAGLYDVQEGQITYDGLPRGNLGLSSLHTVIGDSLAQEQLFAGTVLENITMGRTTASFDNVRHVVTHLGLEEFIRSLPQGFDTELEPQGKGLPGSIVQKLLLARSIVDNPKLLLLEDAFEHLDETERRRIIDFLTD
ncbi:MAG: ABC transporter ATP-binding protein, partial [Bacteroidota bacterium]